MTASGARSAGTITVVAAASGLPCMSVVRYSSWVALTRCGIRPMNASSTSRLRSTVPGCGVLEAGRRVVERVIGRQLRAGAAHQFLVRYVPDPLGTGCWCDAAQIHPAIVT